MSDQQCLTQRSAREASDSYGKSGVSRSREDKREGRASRRHSGKPERHRRRASRSYSVSRSRSRSRSPGRSEHFSKHKTHRTSRSPSRSASDDERKSNSKHKRRHRDKHRDRSRSPRRHRKHRREKKEKTIAVTSQWGKYGVINESNIYDKEEEFKTWLVEECKTNPETLNKDQTKKFFARYMEDYNTATLPHEKFYNMKRYESQMNLLRNGEFLPQGDEDTYDVNADYRAHSSALKSTAAKSESYLTREQLLELRQVERERVELIKRKQLGLQISGTLGVRMDGEAVDELLDM